MVEWADAIETPVSIYCLNSPADIWAVTVSLAQQLLSASWHSPASPPPGSLWNHPSQGKRKRELSLLQHFPEFSLSKEDSWSYWKESAALLLVLFLKYPLLYASALHIWMLRSPRTSVPCHCLTAQWDGMFLCSEVESCWLRGGFHSSGVGGLGQQVSTFREGKDCRLENEDLRRKSWVTENENLFLSLGFLSLNLDFAEYKSFTY